MAKKQLVWRWLHEPATEEMVSEVEKFLGHQLPLDYIQYARIYHGAMTSGNEFVYIIENDKEYKSGMAELFSLEAESLDSIISVNKDLAEQIPSGLVAFAVDGGDGFICFDYRANEDNPTIAFWIQGALYEKVYPLAESFTAFIATLES
jgi:hypothetical protein